MLDFMTISIEPDESLQTLHWLKTVCNTPLKLLDIDEWLPLHMCIDYGINDGNESAQVHETFGPWFVSQTEDDQRELTEELLNFADRPSRPKKRRKTEFGVYMGNEVAQQCFYSSVVRISRWPAEPPQKENKPATKKRKRHKMRSW
jgi:hypothetical protein